MNALKLTLIVLTLSIWSCASKPLSAEEKAVKLMRKSDPPASCKEIGKVHAPGLGSLSEEGRENDLKRAAFEKGGNTVTIDRTDENNTLFGTAFNCN